MNAVDESGCTALWYACLANRSREWWTNDEGQLFQLSHFSFSHQFNLFENEEFSLCNKVRLLIENGADVNLGRWRGETALMKAVLHVAYKGIHDNVRLLLERQADVNAADERGRTALMMAASFDGDKSIEHVRLLLKHRADVNAADSLGLTALIKASERGLDSVVRLLLASQADVNAAGQTFQYVGELQSCSTKDAQSGYTALMASIHGCHRSTSRLLLENRADVNATIDPRGVHTPANFSALMCEIAIGDNMRKRGYDYDTSTLRLLLEHQADVNATDPRGWTALMMQLHVDTVMDDMEPLRLLLEYKADVNAADKLGQTALTMASKLGFSPQDSLFQLLLAQKSAHKKKKLMLARA